MVSVRYPSSGDCSKRSRECCANQWAFRIKLESTSDEPRSLVASLGKEREEGQSELIPFWHVETDKYKIERLVPFYPFSRDRAKLSSILKTLSIVRLAFGPPRQTELVEHLFKHVPQDRIADIWEKLMVDLSPICYRQNLLSEVPMMPESEEQ